MLLSSILGIGVCFIFMETSQIWRSYHSDIRNFIRSKVKDDQVVDDLIQETFVKVHLNKDTLRDDTKIKSWVFTIARNTIYDFFKENKYLNTPVVEKISEEIENIHTEKDCLPGLINNLPKKYGEALFLSDIVGMKQKQIAQQLDMPLPTVKSQVQRARKLIIQGYMKCCNYTLNEKGKLVGVRKEKEDCKICN